MDARKKWAGYITSHGDHNIDLWKLIQELTVLLQLHIDTVQPLYQTNGVPVDLRLGFGSR